MDANDKEQLPLEADAIELKSDSDSSEQKLLRAVTNDDLEGVKDTCAFIDNLKASLSLALEKGHLDIALYLMNQKQGAKTNSRELLMAIAKYTTEANQQSVKELLQKIKDAGGSVDPAIFNYQKRGECNALFYAVRHNPDAVKPLLEAGANPNKSNAIFSNVYFPLHGAYTRNVVELLLAHGAKMEARDAWARTALHLALLDNRMDAFHCLREKGANMDAVDNNGITPRALYTKVDRKKRFYDALAEGNDVNAEALLNEESGFEQEVLNDGIFYALNNKACIELLIRYGADVNAVNNNTEKSRPLHKAMMLNNSEAAQCLFLHGADPTTKDANGMTPLEFFPCPQLSEQIKEFQKLYTVIENGSKKECEKALENFGELTGGQLSNLIFKISNEIEDRSIFTRGKYIEMFKLCFDKAVASSVGTVGLNLSNMAIARCVFISAKHMRKDVFPKVVSAIETFHHSARTQNILTKLNHKGYSVLYMIRRYSAYELALYPNIRAVAGCIHTQASIDNFFAHIKDSAAVELAIKRGIGFTIKNKDGKTPIEVDTADSIKRFLRKHMQKSPAEILATLPPSAQQALKAVPEEISTTYHSSDIYMVW